MSEEEVASSPVAARCRRNACQNHESEGVVFKKCGRCHVARYCSRECQVSDWSYHKMMCNPDRVVLNDDDTITPVGANAVAGAAAAGKAGNGKGGSSDYISPLEMDDSNLFASVVEKLQIETSPFAVAQYRRGNEQRGIVLVQGMSPLEDFRHIKSKHARTGAALDRGVLVHYVSWAEFTEGIAKEHPCAGFRDKKFLRTVAGALEKYTPTEELVTVGVFPCGFVSCVTAPMPPYKTIVAMLDSEPGMFEGQDALEIYLDRQ